jgi:hypothetical protein
MGEIPECDVSLPPDRRVTAIPYRDPTLRVVYDGKAFFKPAECIAYAKEKLTRRAISLDSLLLKISQTLGCSSGIVGIFVAIRTLKVIESQTRVLVESQRPRIVAGPHGDPSKTLADPHARRVELEVTNKSSMPATDYRYESWIEVLPFPFEDFTVAADHFKSDKPWVLYPDTPQIINIPIRGGITPEDFIEIKRLRKHVCVRLYIEYADPFIANRRCYANFGFHILPKGLGFLEKYNGVGYEDKKA